MSTSCVGASSYYGIVSGDSVAMLWETFIKTRELSSFPSGSIVMRINRMFPSHRIIRRFNVTIVKELFSLILMNIGLKLAN